MNDTLENGTNSSIPFIPIRTAISILVILGLPINSYVLGLILSGVGGLIASELFYLNLTASVMFFTLAFPVFDFAWIFTGNGIFSMVGGFVLFCFLFSVPLFQCCICVERYIAVVHPVLFIRYKPLRYRVGCCCVVWLMVLIFSVFILFTVVTVGLSILLGFYVVCISVVSFCCFSVLRALKQPGPGEGQRNSGEGIDMKSRAFRLILISLIVMLLTAMSSTSYFLSQLLNTHTITLATIITYAITKMSVFVHPLLYIHKAGKLPCFNGL